MNKCNNCKKEPCRCGRPKKQFDDETVAYIEEYSRNNNKTGTIAEALSLPYETLKRRFGKRMTHWRALGQINLKRIQQRMANFNPQMAIWLGKQDLGQVDKQVITTEPADSKSKTPQELEAAKAASRAYNEAMSKQMPTIKIMGQEAG